MVIVRTVMASENASTAMDLMAAMDINIVDGVRMEENVIHAEAMENVGLAMGVEKVFFQKNNNSLDSLEKDDEVKMTFGGHLDALRRVIVQILLVTLIFAIIIFVFKVETFDILLSPSEWDFCTYRWLEKIIGVINPGFRFNEFHINLIATDLSSQFMTHVTTSIYLGLLCASPFILYELFKFVSPALLESEKKYSVRVVCIIYILFVIGVLMSYFVLFPISFRFLGTYSVADKVHSTITLDSYISTFVSLTLMMGLVFQLPVIAYILGRMGFVHSSYLIKYRSYAILLICIVAAIITPPDLMTLFLVAIPLYMLYEISIKVIKRVEKPMIESE